MLAGEVQMGQEYVVKPNPRLANGDVHRLFNGMEVVIPVAGPDDDGEFTVQFRDNTEVVIGSAFLLPDYMITIEEAQALIEEHGGCPVHEHEHDFEQEDTEDWQTVTLGSDNMPNFSDVPVGWGMGFVAYFLSANKEIAKMLAS